MKNALIIGGGSKWGLEFTKELVNQGYDIDLITGSDVNLPNVNCVKINWFNVDKNLIKSLINTDKNYDLIFFNHNSGGNPNDHFLKSGNEIELEQWNYTYWINCQLPYVIIHHLSKNINQGTKIGWMLTGLIDGHNPDMFRYSGYAAVKSTNLHLMRGFSQFHQGIFFAINPGHLSVNEYQKDALQIFSVIKNIKQEDSGKVFNKDGSFWI